jgi:hypothetical protein
MKLLPIAIAAGALAASCTSPEVAHNHWHLYSVVPAIERHGFGYDEDRDGGYTNRLGDDAGSIWATFRQHMVGSVYDPTNPLMGDVGRRSPPPAAPDNPYDDEDSDD